MYNWSGLISTHLATLHHKHIQHHLTYYSHRPAQHTCSTHCICYETPYTTQHLSQQFYSTSQYLPQHTCHTHNTCLLTPQYLPPLTEPRPLCLFGIYETVVQPLPTHPPLYLLITHPPTKPPTPLSTNLPTYPLIHLPTHSPTPLPSSLPT